MLYMSEDHHELAEGRNTVCIIENTTTKEKRASVHNLCKIIYTKEHTQTDKHTPF